MNTFLHAGDYGDIIYSLPTIRALGGGALYLGPVDGTRLKMTPERAEAMATLLRIQPYIAECKFHDGQFVLYDLNLFRQRFRAWNFSETLVESHCRQFRVDPSVADTPWLTCPKERGGARVVFNLTSRYRNFCFPWREAYRRYKSDAVFVGTDTEYHDFACQVGPIDHAKTPTVLDLARVINSCSLFIGGQSLPLSIAHGLGKPVCYEMSPRDYNGHRRTDAMAWYTWGANIHFPNLEDLP